MKLLKKIYGIKIEVYVAVFMFLMGFVMMNLVPTWQTPDEGTHLEMIGQEIGKDIDFANTLREDVGIEPNRIIRNFDEKVNVDEITSSMTREPQYSKSEMLPEKISLSFIRHFPATIGILVGILMGVPSYWVLFLGELFALIFYVAVCYKALQIMPIKKELFAVIMLMPMALHQAGSLNYDAVVIPLIFFMIAYVFKLKYQDEIGLKDFVKLLVLWAIITYIKMPYAFLILLLLILPLDKIHIRIGKLDISGTLIKKIRLPICIIGIFLVGAAVYFLRNVFYVEMILSLILEWKRALFLFFQTGATHTKSMIISTVGNFGWLDTPVRFDFALVVFAMITALALVNNDNKTEKSLKTWDRVIIWGTAIALCVFTTTAMINHTVMTILYGYEWAEGTYDIRTALYQIPFIGGIQGRYFLPFVSLIFVPLPQIKKVNKKIIWGAVALFEIALFIYIIHKLLERHWIIC